MAKKCTKCGCELKTKVKFCPECGTLVEEDSKKKKIKEEQAKAPGEKKGKGKIIAGAVIMAAVVLGVGGFVAAKTMNKKSEEPVKKEAKADTKKKETKETGKAKEPQTYHYQWYVNPSIEADQLYYVMRSESDKPFNEYHKQFDSQCTVIEKDGLKGWIDYTSMLCTDIKYNSIAFVTGQSDAICYMKTPEGQYQEYNEYESIEVRDINSPLQFVGEEYSDDLSYYTGIDVNIHYDMDAISKETENLTNNPYWNAGYYYNGEVRYVHTSKYGESTGEEVLEGTMPMRESDKILTKLAEWKQLDGKYAIVSNGEPVTDFIYDECGSESEGLFAVCQEGKWGYVDEKGKVVIPMEYDTSWNRYSDDEAQASNVDAAPAADDYCYAASNGYVNLRQGDKWKLCDTNGKEIIPFGEFDEILPVDLSKFCWVKKDGKWGVIKILEEEATSTEYTSWKDTYVDWLDSAGDDYTYELIEMDNNVVPEIVAIAKDSSQNSILVTCEGAWEDISPESVETKNIRYLPKENMLQISGGSMDDYWDEFYMLQNGDWQFVKRGRYYTDAELQLNADGTPIYAYEWEDEEVSKEQYEKNIESLMPSDKAVNVGENGVSSAEIISQIRNYKN